jgi:hypothetical protein
MYRTFRSLRRLALGALASLFLAGAAAAATISMDPGAVTVSTVLGFGNDFTLALESGDTSNNRLNFSIAGGGGSSWRPVKHRRPPRSTA